MSEFIAGYTNSYALVMGVDDYQQLPPLQAAVRGTHDLADLLEQQLDFRVTRLTDDQLTRDAIFRWLNNTRRTAEPDDRVLIYFAGHGMTRGQGSTERGYLCLADTIPDEWHTAIPMDDIIEETGYFTCKHVLYVLDCCFSGIALQGRSVADVPRDLSFYLTRPVRYAITAGGREVVDDSLAPDGQYSLFTYFLMQWLTDERVRPAGGVWRARDLGNHLEQVVASNRRSGHKPNHSYLPGSGDGDFVFRWETGIQLPREIEIPLMAANPAVRLGAVTALIEIVQESEEDLAALARSKLEDIAEEDNDEAIREVAEAFLEGRDIDKDKEEITSKLLEKLEQAERRQAQQEQMLASTREELEVAREEASQARERLIKAAPVRTFRLIFWRPFLEVVGIVIILALIPLIPSLLLEKYNSAGFELAALAFVLVSGLSSLLYVHRVQKSEPGVLYREVPAGGAALGAIEGLVVVVGSNLIDYLHAPYSGSALDYLFYLAPFGAAASGILGGLATLISLAVLRRAGAIRSAVRKSRRELYGRALAISLGIALIPALIQVLGLRDYYPYLRISLCSFIPLTAFSAGLYVYLTRKHHPQLMHGWAVLGGGVIVGLAGFAEGLVSVLVDYAATEILFLTTAAGILIGSLGALVSSVMLSKRGTDTN